MKQTLLITLFSFVFSSFINASTDTFSHKVAVIGSPSLSSDPCAAIDKKLLRLDEFTTMVNSTSAFYLEEKAEALAVPGISVSNNKKKMLRDAKKKYTEYSAERQKYGCDTPMSVSMDEKDVVATPALPSEPSAAIEKEPVKQDKNTAKAKVKNTTTVPKEAKPEVVKAPKITASKNEEQMIKVEEKEAETVEGKDPKYLTETPVTVTSAKMADERTVVSEPVLSISLSDSCADIDKKLTELYEFMMMVNNTSAFHLEEKAEALSVPGISVSNNKKKMLRDAKKKYDKLLAERKQYGCDTLEN